MQTVNTNVHLHEEKKHGMPEFPLEFNVDDTRDYYHNDINWHWHKEFEIVCILEGSVTCHINQSTYDLKQGEGIFINSGVLHRFTSNDYGVITNIIFLPGFLASGESLVYQKYIMPLEKSVLSCVTFKKEEIWQKQMLLLLEKLFLRLAEPEWNELWIRNQVSKMWLIMMEHLDHRQLVPKAVDHTAHSENMLQVMIQYIQMNYGMPITLADIADAASISKNTALRYFQENIGISPVEYLIQYRISMACKMLRETSEKIAYISDRAGYDNVSYFNRIFKKYVGKTPGQYRSVEKQHFRTGECDGSDAQ